MTDKILITHPVHEDVYHRLAAVAEVDMNPDLEPWPYAEVCRRAADATAIMGFMTDRVDTELLTNAPRLKIIACALKGYDNYDAEACAQAGVWLSIVPDLLTAPTAELAVALALGLARHVRAGDAFVRQGNYRGWRPHFYGYGLHNSTVAVLGLGRLGSALVERLQGFGCARILGVDTHASLPGVVNCSLQDALAQADFVFSLLPLSEETWHLLDAAHLRACKPGQLLINVGRGSVVDELAVADVLAEGRLGGYAADVFSCEDWAYLERLRKIPDVLLLAENTLFTPHLGSAVHSARRAIEHRAADNILAVLAGRAPEDAVAEAEIRLAVCP